MLSVQGLCKAYQGRSVVQNLSFDLVPGEVLGLLGPNGAGKTTTVSMVCGLVPPDAGQVRVDGVAIQGDADPTKRRLGLVPQELALYEPLSARANLDLFAALYQVPRASRAQAVDEALHIAGLADRANDRVADFSGGMKRRLNIACALVHRPDVLIFDEPTVGVDPQSRNAIFEVLLALKAQGKALLYTTHYMEEAERLCDRVAIMDGGRIVAQDRLSALLAQHQLASTLDVALDAPADEPLLQALRALPSVAAADSVEAGLRVLVHDLGVATAAVLALLQSRGLPVRQISSGRASLEALFLQLTGRQLRD